MQNQKAAFLIPPYASLKTALIAVVNPMPFYNVNQKLYPDIFASSLLFFSAYVIHSPEFIKRVLQENHKNYTKGGKYGFIRLLLGDGLLTSDGEHWLRHRKIIQPSFHKNSLEYSREVMLGETLDFLKTFGDTGILNANARMADLTTNIVGKSMFGLSSTEKITGLRTELDKCQKYGHNLLRMPITYPKWILKIPLFSKLDSAINNVHTIVRDFIIERRKTNEEERASEQKDLLDLMMSLRYEETNELMSIKQIQDELLTLIVAGHETTTLVLAWTLYELSRHAEIQENARQEVQNMVSKPEDLTFEKLGQLTYLGNVLNESMRLYPPAYLFARTATDEDSLGPYHVPAGKNIVINLYGLHRNPRFWEDPDIFKPERFVNFDSSGLNKFKFLPFGGGPRGCIGNHFAIAEMKIIIASILLKYRLTPANNKEVVPKPLFTFNPSEPVLVNLEAL